MHGADGVQTRQRAEHDAAFGGFFGNGIGTVQRVVGISDAVGGKTVADEFVALVFAVADDVHAQTVEQPGDFRIGFGVQPTCVVEHFGFRRNDFGGNGAGGHDARHLAVDDVGLFAPQHSGVGNHAFEVAEKAAAIEIDGLPTYAQGLRLFEQRSVRRGKDDVVSVLPEQPAEAEGGVFRAAQTRHRGGQNDFHDVEPMFFRRQNRRFNSVLCRRMQPAKYTAHTAANRGWFSRVPKQAWSVAEVRQNNVCI